MSQPAVEHTETAPGTPHQGALAPLALAALGVVFGDIGTSPIYTVKECINGEHPLQPTPDNVLGVCSLIFWSLTMVVTVKYLSFIMRADNHGEGGILALLALIPEKMRSSRAKIGWVALLVIIGAALLFGDGIITPAVSVLSAMEGLEVATSKLKGVVIPLTCVILFLLFAIQKRGTAGIGKLFGPVMMLWFLTIGVLGTIQIAHNPVVLWALWPGYGLEFFRHHGLHGIPLLGSVVLAVTGGEALYADMGHFGARPIRVSWLLVVMPTLVLCYLGQGALLLRDPAAISSPFFALLPLGFWTYAMVILSGAATVIASQALISGVFSLTHQAVQLGFFPRVTITHTSSQTEGQIYVPEINWGLALACIALVLGFRASSRLAAAYGIAVSGTMAITSVVYYIVARQTWGWPRVKALPVLLLFLSFDLPFLAANLLKFWDGGYVPLMVGAGFLVVMVVWKRGRAYLREYMDRRSLPWEEFMAGPVRTVVARIPGAGVFLASCATGTPPLLMNHVQRLRVLPEAVVLLTVLTERRPYVSEAERLEVTDLGQGFFRLVGRYGFMEQTRLPELLKEAVERCRLPIDPQAVTYFLGRETFLATEKGQMGRFTESLFSFLVRNSRSATDYFSIPPEQVMEIGAQIDL